MEHREQFASRWGFALAAIGSAVGLGNIWRFPFMAGENGGGAFISLYFLFILLFGIPALMAMILIGRRGGKALWAVPRRWQSLMGIALNGSGLAG